jgi:hypothetical protein
MNYDELEIAVLNTDQVPFYKMPEVVQHVIRCYNERHPEYVEEYSRDDVRWQNCTRRTPYMFLEAYRLKAGVISKTFVNEVTLFWSWNRVNAEIAGRDSERSADSLVAGCTEPDRESCPRLCSDFCNKHEEATNADASKTEGSGERIVELVEQWENRAKTADKLASDAAGAGDWATNHRCKTKAGVIRNMTAELKREISQANAEVKHGR